MAGSLIIRPRDAWDMMQDAGLSGIGLETLLAGIRQGRWPWADCIAASTPGGKDKYIIYALPFRSWLRERSPYVKEDAPA